MTKGFSLGDFSVNQQADNKSSSKGFKLEDYNKVVPTDE
jgi:hypothetical protein